MSSPHSSPALARCFAASFVLAFAVTFSGCAHTYKVKVDALANSEVTAGSAYRLVAHDDVKADFDPHFDQNRQIIEQALAIRGMYPADNPRDADVVIEIEYGIGSRRRTARASMEPYTPVRMFAPGSAALERSSESAHQPAEVATQSEASKPITAITVVTLYEKYLTISARETEHATAGRRHPSEVWRVTVAVEDQETTVEACLPVLVATAIEKIGTSTDEREMVRVSGRAPTVLAANTDL